MWISHPWSRIASSYEFEIRIFVVVVVVVYVVVVVVIIIVESGDFLICVWQKFAFAFNRGSIALKLKSVAEIGGNSFWPPHKRAVRAVVKIIIPLAALEIKRPSRCIAVA